MNDTAPLASTALAADRPVTADRPERPAWPPAQPLVAILRGLPPADAAAVGQALFDAGFRTLEVPLNRPGALESLAILAAMAPADALVGAGTVLDTAQVDAVAAAGGRLIVMPHADVAVIRHARAHAAGLRVAPGVFTATEAFAALAAGADALKLFPAEVLQPAGLKALRAVLPAEVPLWPVGGVSPGNLAAWRAAGAHGAGLGSALYPEGAGAAEVATRAAAFIAAWRGGQAG
ncbi:2-dehydro-3-deoxy-6-phosphogalactonate aldolase [Aquabacterium sp. OR-4]|uniref:2-dehydro-3-deoxy-6-phosphogalactonate aldolase n=1 Tax=Aquabacterium sp. OR-4 TaxID=2978127 RepID=UPI0028C7515A|nr:2-dehydro-3-deoxy-6-phosphogalactonate aldolase [Aquabacterium sp. OR-4]MDT7835676.1 2-dehydro-3-deoxy-6-phosphogalactonate aldolase [Aquabacterium sp. OR-4]